MVEISANVLVTAILSLCGIIGTLAGAFYSSLKARITQQEKRIDDHNKYIDGQNAIIKGLQRDIERLSMGCGANGCFWKSRKE